MKQVLIKMINKWNQKNFEETPKVFFLRVTQSEIEQLKREIGLLKQQ